MPDRLHLPPKHRRVLEALLREHLPDVEVWAYGSRVSGKSHEGSDLDLVLRGPGLKEISLGQLGDFEEAVRESTIPFLVEARDWSRLPDRFHQEIERDHVVLLERIGGKVPGRQIKYLGEIANIVMGQSPPGDSVSSSDGLPLLNGPTEFGPHHPIPVQFTTDSRKYSQRGDILFCVRGSTTGRMNWADQRYAIGRGIAAICHKYDVAFQPFIRAVIEYALPELLAQATGSTFPNVSAHQLAAIPYPELDENEQRAAAQFLGSIDDKIELNRRMNETLEEMARALFKSWFVDFDPVRAKMEGRDPGLPTPLADLFPDRLVDSELGEIPEGWKAKGLGDLLVLAYGKALKADSRQHDGDVPVYGSNGQVGWHDERLVRGPGIVVGRKGNPGIVMWVNTDFFCIDTTFYVIAKGSCNSLHFLLHALTHQDLPSIAADSAVPGLNRNLAYMNRQVVPSEEIIGYFDTYVGPLFSQGACLRKEAQTLTSLRDALLPKLISGDIRVGDAEKVVEAVA